MPELGTPSEKTPSEFAEQPSGSSGQVVGSTGQVGGTFFGFITPA
jgi:hypothetical protein